MVVYYTLLSLYESGLLHVYSSHHNMFLHGSGVFYNFPRTMPSPEHDSDREERTNIMESHQVLADVPEAGETATTIATAIINALVDSVPIISGGIPANGGNPTTVLDVTPDVAEIINAVYRGKGSMMESVVTTPRRNSTRTKSTTKPRAKYATQDDLDSVLGPQSSSDHGSWRKQKKHKVSYGPKN